jgi:hypothetical protein
MKTKIGVFLVLAVLLGACNSATPAPASAVEQMDLAATIAVLEEALTEIPVGVGVPVVVLATPEPPASVVLPTPTPEYRVVECGPVPRNGTLIQMLKPMASRECHDARCHKDGHAVVGSVRPLEGAWAEDGEWWLLFTYLPLEEKPYNLLDWEKKDGDWQWVLQRQYVLGTVGDDFQCVEPWAE